LTEEHDQDVEVLPPERSPMGGGGGRVFDADGRLERAESPRASGGRFQASAGGGRAQVRGGCALPLGRWFGRLLLFGAFIAGGIWLLSGSGASHTGALAWLRDGGFETRLAAIGVITLLTPIFLPAGLMAVVPGYAWGPVEGTLISLAGAAVGGLLNMALARRLLGRRIARWAERNPLLAAVKRSIDRRGFRIALALRMSPITPYAALSYLAGLSSLSWGAYTVASIVGGIPWTLAWATAGSVVAESQQPLSLAAAPDGTWAGALRWIGLGFTVLVAWWIARAARKELAIVRAEMAADRPFDGFQVHVGTPEPDDPNAPQEAEVQSPEARLDVEP